MKKFANWSARALAAIVVLGATQVHSEPPTKNIYWGDLHIHTSYSMDAFVLNNQTTPADAYHFAAGGKTKLSDGSMTQLERPLDFAAVTDHAEYFGLMQVCRNQPKLPYCVELAAAAKENSTRGFLEFFLPTLLRGDRNCQVDDKACRAAEINLWQRSIEATEAAYVPGKFTTFIANEWTASPDNLHWHRNLIYANKNVPMAAINSFDQPTQESMWQALRDQCANPTRDCDVLAIPHNANIGLGGTYNTQGHGEELLSLRARFEKLVEIHQHKGSSECYPGSTFKDEACNFEIAMPIPIRNELRATPRELTATEHAQISSGYVRDTLAKGLGLRSSAGVNPFRYGFIGATDSHSGRPGAVEEDNWRGALGQWDTAQSGQQGFSEYNPGGLTAIWAYENTREALFAALKNREVYATSGPRIRLNFSQTSTKPDENGAISCGQSSNTVTSMGGTLSTPVDRSKPNFQIHAMMDRDPLASVDLVKIYLRDDKLQQKVIRIADHPSGQREICLNWMDESYNPDELSLWYVRVLQLPTLRWDGTTKIQERAWSSPIWSTQ